MSDGHDVEHFHIVTRQSQALEIVVHLPSFCKPLAASVRPYGSGEAGLLASYYDPELHAWIVRQLPLHEAWPHRPPPLLVVRVITVVDPANLYELRIVLASVLDGIDNDVLYALQRRSQLYAMLAEEHLADTTGQALQSASTLGQLPHLSEAVSLAAPLEVLEGFVLTGGGFSSDFPILREGPALPRSMDSVYDDVLSGDVLCGPPLPANGGGPAAPTPCVESGEKDGQEYTAWSVTAAANAGLVCFSLGLRRRSALEVAQQQRDRFASPALQGTSPSALETTNSGGPLASRLGYASVEAGWAEQDPTGLVVSRSPSDYGAAVRTAASTLLESTGGAPRPLLETLTLRGEVEVKLARRDGEQWHISLPPPHGKFAFAMGPNREFMTVARKTFYCE